MHGIDLSPAMIEQLQAKPGSSDIDVTVGDFATMRVEGAFDDELKPAAAGGLSGDTSKPL